MRRSSSGDIAKCKIQNAKCKHQADRGSGVEVVAPSAPKPRAMQGLNSAFCILHFAF
jgi:hypothetical protein